MHRESGKRQVGSGVRRSRIVGLFAGPGLAVALSLTGAPAGLEPIGWYTAAIAVWMAIWWMSEAVPLAVASRLARAPVRPSPTATPRPSPHTTPPHRRTSRPPSPVTPPRTRALAPAPLSSPPLPMPTTRAQPRPLIS